MCSQRLLVYAAIMTVGSIGCLSGQDTAGSPNVFPGGDMTEFTEQPNPWGGVDAAGNLRGLLADQLAVDDNGRIGGMNLSPGIAIGDLNGDGLLDLVLADPKGFFWFFPNSGTKTEPKFTSGEVMPIWLGSVPARPGGDDSGPNHDGPVDHLVPRIQLVDFDGDGKLDLVVGTFPGKLFYVRNTGSAAQPAFATPKDLSELKSVPTRRDGRLDNNYFSPFLCDWYGDGHLNLVRGDGTYSANSIILMINKGTNADPVFNETDRTKIVPGMGREHLTPIMLDWNGDGKLDVLTGERTGQIELFLNTSPDRDHPSFDQGQKLKIGGQDKFGQFTTVAAGALSGNPKVPDLLISNDSGEVLYCHNAGTPGSPNFSAKPQPLKGVNPYPKILVSNRWALGWFDYHYPYPLHGWGNGSPQGVPYELVLITNAQKEQGFAPPDGVTWKNALKYEVLDHKNVYFTDSYYPKNEDETQVHSFCNTADTSLESDTNYEISFWIKGDGVHDLSYHFHGWQQRYPGTEDRSANHIDIKKPVSIGPTWNKVTDSFSWPTTSTKKHDTIGCAFQLEFYGQGTIYLSDVQVHKK